MSISLLYKRIQLLLLRIIYAGVTMLLTLSVLQVIVSEKLPTTSEAVPFLGKSSCYYLKSYF